LRTLVRDLLFDGSARAAFAGDPARYLEDHGWGDLGGDDVASALGALVDELPIDEAAALSPVIAEDGSFDGGLAGAIAGLRAATDAIDDEAAVAAPLVGPDSPIDAPPNGDPSLGIDEDDVEGEPPEPSDGPDDDDVWAAGDDEGAFGDVAELPSKEPEIEPGDDTSGLDENGTLPDPLDELDAAHLPFGALPEEPVDSIDEPAGDDDG
jgi:hypothetical protein